MGAESLVSADSYGHTPYRVEQPAGVRCVYVYEHIADAAFTTPVLADWYEYPDLTNAVSTQTNTFLSVRDGATYLVVAGDRRDTFAVFDYATYRMAGRTVKALLDCENSVLSIDVPQMTYYSLKGQAYTVARDILVRYTDIQRDSVSWVEKDREDSLNFTLPSNINLEHKLLAPTQIDILGDRMA